MFHSRSLPILLVLGLSIALPACGGGGHGYRVVYDPLEVTSTVLPASLSGQALTHVIPLTGGCDGPYVLSVIEGTLPDGLALDDETHAITGYVLEAGSFSFTIQIVDSGCTPFDATTAKFTWNVGVGPVVIINSIPAWTPVGGPENPLYPALPTTVYNEFTSMQILVAGGQSPYSCQVYDDPNVPNDGNMPQGTIIPPDSCSIVGAPVEVKAGGVPFIITIEATDGLGEKAYQTIQWKIDTPPIIIATTFLPDGKCGTNYSEQFIVVEGVPPFIHELTEMGVADPENDVTYQSPNPPIVNPPQALNQITAAFYPPQNLDGPDYAASNSGAPPEGLMVREATGNVFGTPRRRGDFELHYHVRSSLVPNERGQHNWMSYPLHVDPSEPPVGMDPAFGQDPNYTNEKAFFPPPYSSIPDAEVGVTYNPDAATHPSPGLKVLAVGGVAKDGLTDGPHESQTTNIEGLGPTQEELDGYDWTLDWGSQGQPAGMTFTDHLGVLTGPGTNPPTKVPQGYQDVTFTVLDQQLPLSVRNQVSQTVQFAVGPDTVVITESTTSVSATTRPGPAMNDHNMKARILVPLSTSPSIRDLTNADMPATHSVPSTASTTSLQTLLTGMDIMRVSINPTGWWDDVHNLNANAARAHQHGDGNAEYFYYSHGRGSNYQYNPDTISVHIPKCTAPSVTHNPAGGVYTNGGQLYVFDTSSNLGVFLIRPDSRIYVPAAFQMGSPYRMFGDSVVESRGSSKHSLMRLPQMTVSPDGRFAAMKLLTTSPSTSSYTQAANSTKILLFSLTGEKVFGGATYKVIDTGANGSSSSSTSTGRYQYAASLTLTDRYLYYLVGRNTGAYSSWRDHFIYRYEITSGNSGGSLLHSSFNSDWRNYAGQAMQTPFHKYESMGQTGFMYTGSGFIMVQAPRDEMYLYDGANIEENSVAPHPFRVSANGKACAIIAGLNTTNYNASDVMLQDVWVDYDGSLHELSSTRRHSPHGGGRGTSLARGPNSYYHWGQRTGPTTAFEISDDGQKVAVVVNRDSSIYATSTTSGNWDQREDVIAFSSNGTNWAGGATEIQVTGTESSTTPIFRTPALWKFGALTFTKDNNGLVFWGGYSGQNATSTSTSSSSGAHTSNMFNGSMYSYDFGSGQVKNILHSNAGGNKDNYRTYTTSSGVNPTLGTWNANQGVVHPIGGFVSKNREFFYICSWAPLTSSDSAHCRLVGVNIRSLNTATNINSHPDGRAFAVSGFPSRKGFMDNYYYRGYYIFYYRYYSPSRSQGQSRQVAALDNGRVFFAEHGRNYQQGTGGSTYGPAYNITWNSSYSHCWRGEVNAFDADIGGPVQRLTKPQLGGNSYRAVVYLEPSRSGRQLGFVYSDTGTQRNYSRERVGYIGDIDFDSAGVLLPGASKWKVPTTSNGRAGDSMAHDFTSTKMFFAFGAGAGNETGKKLWEAKYDSATGTVTTRSFGSNKRYNVLHSGR